MAWCSGTEGGGAAAQWQRRCGTKAAARRYENDGAVVRVEGRRREWSGENGGSAGREAVRRRARGDGTGDATARGSGRRCDGRATRRAATRRTMTGRVGAWGDGMAARRGSGEVTACGGSGHEARGDNATATTMARGAQGGDGATATAMARGAGRELARGSGAGDDDGDTSGSGQGEEEG
uniref:Uncharacterized protein n=1 Tax=Oryza sativa subsp. japonica TaxID=39947 RepID=Q94LT4_ORYSJ|nr:hypothetical protein [Oryza sativa Japonica Group]